MNMIMLLQTLVLQLCSLFDIFHPPSLIMFLPNFLSQKGGKVSKAYGSSLSIPGFGTFSNRQTYIIDPQKNIRWVFVDVESRIPQHPSDVLAKLNELQQA